MVTVPLESANRLRTPAENSPGFAPKKRQVHSICRRTHAISFGLLFTAQPEAPAIKLAGASGWAVNAIPFYEGLCMKRNCVNRPVSDCVFTGTHRAARAAPLLFERHWR